MTGLESAVSTIQSRIQKVHSSAFLLASAPSKLDRGLAETGECYRGSVSLDDDLDIWMKR